MATKKRLTTEQLLGRVQRLATKHGAVIYTINNRRAGWGVTWHEQERVKTKIPKILTYMGVNDDENRRKFMDSLRANAEASQAAKDEGLVTYAYRPSLRACLAYELERLKKLDKKPANS